MTNFTIKIIKIILALGLLLFGLVGMSIIGVIVFRDAGKAYIEEQKVEILGPPEKTDETKRWSDDCEIMDPVIVKFENVTLTYPPSVGFSVSNTKNNPILRRKSGADDRAQFCRPEAGFIEPLSLSAVTSRSFERVSANVGISPPLGVSSIYIAPLPWGIENRAYNRLDLSGTGIDGGYCVDARRTERKRCHLLKQIHDSDIYIEIVIRPASPRGGRDLQVYTKDDWPGIVAQVELILSHYITVH